MKIGLIDIETTNLNADYGFVLCACYKMHGDKKIEYTRIDESATYKKCKYDDSKCIRDIYKWIEDNDIDILVHYNGDRFDIPYINSRLLVTKIRGKYRGLPKFRSIDHFRTSKFKLKLHNCSLDTLAKFLKLNIQKTPYGIETWKKAAFGDKKSLDKIVNHCKKDVLVLEACHDRLTPLLKSLRPLN